LTKMTGSVFQKTAVFDSVLQKLYRVFSSFLFTELVELIASRSDSELEVQRYGMRTNTFDCWWYVGRWSVKDTKWKTVPQTVKVGFWKQTRKVTFQFLEFWGQFGSVFRKPICIIFIGFRTPLSHHTLCNCWLLMELKACHKSSNN